MKLSFINLILINFFDYVSSKLASTCGGMEMMGIRDEILPLGAESHNVMLQKWMEIDFDYDKAVRSIILKVSRKDDQINETTSVKNMLQVYIKKIIFNVSSNIMTDIPSNWKKEDHYRVIADDNQPRIKLQFLVDCADENVQIDCFYFYNCSSFHPTVREQHIISITDVNIIKKRHRFINLDKLVIEFSMCPAIRYSCIKLTGFGKRGPITISHVKSRNRPKVITVTYKSFGENCLYDNNKITVELALPNQTQTLIIDQVSNCVDPKAQVYIIFILIIVYFILGCGPILSSRKKWYKSMVELDSLKSQLKYLTSKRTKNKSRLMKTKTQN